ncbi:MAG: DUF4144 domain-containing protein [Gammaproteobacteria bacterium]|nr:DUF4144 domain-containing protein [Gammaproteobacteria bacterium]
MTNKSIHWPALIKHAGDAELVYVNDQSEWDRDADLHHFDYDKADYLIDSRGDIFFFTKTSHTTVSIDASINIKPLDEILGLVKAHAAQMGSCCVAKLYAPTIIDAFKMVQSINDSDN